MIKKIVLCLSLLAVCCPGMVWGSDEAIDKAINECREQLLQKYPNVEAIKVQFGSKAQWQEETQPSIHEPDLELQINNMEYPGIEIATLGYSNEGEYIFFITKVQVKKAGIVDFSGIDVGSSREDVLKTFGEPREIDGNVLVYCDEGGFNYLRFTIEKNQLTEMRFNTYLD